MTQIFLFIYCLLVAGVSLSCFSSVSCFLRLWQSIELSIVSVYLLGFLCGVTTSVAFRVRVCVAGMHRAAVGAVRSGQGPEEAWTVLLRSVEHWGNKLFEDL